MKTPNGYLRYQSVLRGMRSKPITKKIEEFIVTQRNDLVVAIHSPMNVPGFKGWQRKRMFLHLNRLTDEVFYFRPGEDPSIHNVEGKVRIGKNGEFITL